VLGRGAQVGYRDILTHLFLIVGVHNLKHLICISCHLDCVKVNVFCSELLDLLLNQSALRVSKRERVWQTYMVIITVARGIS
jgi:hypothetical protein